MRIRRGFSLIELIVVMVVLLLLLAVLLPSLHSGKESGLAVACTNHLQQLSLIAAIYDQDNLSFPHGFCALPEYLDPPPPGGFPGDHSYDRIGWWWFHFMEIEDLSRDGILWCPARKRMSPPIENNILCSNYGMNYAIGRWASSRIVEEFRGPAIRKSQLRQPAQALLFTDSGYALISRNAATEGIPDPFDNLSRVSSFFLPGLEINKDREIHEEQVTDAVKGRHPHLTVNIAYADSHIQREKAEQLYVPRDSEGNLLLTYLWSAGR